jgi:DNA ligase 1
MVRLLQSIDGLSGRYLVRIPLQKLRLGFSDMTILDALSWMEKGDKSLRTELEQAYNIRADIGKISKIFKKDGLAGIKALVPETGTPIVPALSTPLLNAVEILEKMNGKAFIEPKFDGFRVQIHLDKNKPLHEEERDSPLFEENKKAFVGIFSRNLDSTTHMFPELVEAAQALPVDSIILDGEAVAIDPSTGKLLDFQETVKRKRKHNIDQVKEEIPLNVFIFDILYLNDKPLFNLPLKERRKILEGLFDKVTGKLPFTLTEQRLVSNPESFEEFFKEVASEGLEGLMVKKVDAIYRAGKRDFTWVKYKVAMQSELADTVDAVVMGYFKGEGKWTQFGLGKILVGIPHEGKLFSLSKVGSGFSEEKIKEMVKRCQDVKVDQKPDEYVVDKSLVPDVWVRPEILVEIRADSISRSQIHETGLSLRFPRFIKFRDDKEVSQATTLEQVRGLLEVSKNRG